MARARNLKPSFFTNADLCDCEPLARLLFQGLWTECDKEGRLEYHPRNLKIKILPCDNCDIEELAGQLEARGFIKRYEVEGRRYLWVVNFKKHQNPHPKETASQLPEFNGVVELHGEPRKETASPASSTPSLSTSSPSPLLKPPSMEVSKKKRGEYSIMHLLSEQALEKARSAAGGWDIYHLGGIYSKQFDAPSYPDRAFPAWCKTYTSGRPPA